MKTSLNPWKTLFFMPAMTDVAALVLKPDTRYPEMNICAYFLFLIN